MDIITHAVDDGLWRCRAQPFAEVMDAVHHDGLQIIERHDEALEHGDGDTDDEWRRDESEDECHESRYDANDVIGYGVVIENMAGRVEPEPTIIIPCDDGSRGDSVPVPQCACDDVHVLLLNSRWFLLTILIIHGSASRHAVIGGMTKNDEKRCIAVGESGVLWACRCR